MYKKFYRFNVKKIFLVNLDETTHKMKQNKNQSMFYYHYEITKNKLNVQIFKKHQ